MASRAGHCLHPAAAPEVAVAVEPAVAALPHRVPGAQAVVHQRLVAALTPTLRGASARIEITTEASAVITR